VQSRRDKCDSEPLQYGGTKTFLEDVEPAVETGLEVNTADLETNAGAGIAVVGHQEVHNEGPAVEEGI
jgi:hypothetical protein